MKTNILYSAVLALIISSILSSCAFMQKGEFAQRKYYNFPRTNHAINGEKTDFTALNEQKEYSPTITAEKNTPTPEPIITASAGGKPILDSKHRAEILTRKKSAKNNPNTVTSTVLPSDNSNFTIKKSEIRKLARKNIANSNSPNSGGMLIIEIIAAIFFPPLSCFIKDNSKTSKWFWVTLVLCILSLGIYLSGIFAGGLLYLVAIIIALMHALDAL